MTGREAFNIWAPSASKWSQWVRPVMFFYLERSETFLKSTGLEITQSYYQSNADKSTAIIIDLPGAESIKQGLTLAGLGYRPVPLYNGTIGQIGAISLVDNNPIMNALIWGAEELSKMTISDDAPPVFLLDSNRLYRHKMNVSVYDNSWDIYEQDMPTSDYFENNGIDTIIVQSKKVNRDLTKILYKYQKKGIHIRFTDGYNEPQPVKIRKIGNIFKAKIL